MNTHEYIRKEPKPSEGEALNFARSVMESKGVDVDWGVYILKDGRNIENAQKALEAHAIDLSERMALEKINYALEA